MTTYTRKVFYWGVWVILGAILANIFGFLTRLILARNLTIQEYGLVYAVVALFGVVKIFKTLGMDQAITKFTASYTVKKKPAKVKEVFLWAARILYPSAWVVGILGMILATTLAEFYFRETSAAVLLVFFSISVLLSPVHILIPSFLQGLQRLDLRSIYLTSQSCVLFLATLFFLEIGKGGNSLMFAYIIEALFGSIILIFLIRKFRTVFSSKVKLKKDMKRRLIKFGTPVMLAGVAGTVLTQTDTILLTIFSPIAEVGIYQAALPTSRIILFGAGAIWAVLLPLVAELWERRRLGLISKAATDLYKYIFILVLPLIIGMLVYPDFILRVIFGDQYVIGATVLRVLAVASIFFLLNAVNVSTLSGMGMPKKNTFAIVIGAVLNLCLNLILIPLFGGVGAAVSTLLSSIVIFLMGHRLLRQQIKLNIPYWQQAKVLLGGVVFFGMLHGSRIFFSGINQYTKITIALFIGGIMYLLVLFFLRAITLAEVTKLKERILYRR